MEFLDNFLTILKDVRLHPIAVPVLIGLATVLATVVLFYVLSRPKGSQGRKSSKGSDRTKTRTSEQGVRRSSRCVCPEDRWGPLCLKRLN